MTLKDPMTPHLSGKMAHPLLREIQKDLGWQIRDGQLVAITSKLWFSNTNEVVFVERVSDLIEQGSDWNSHKLRFLYNEDTSNQIFQMPISHTEMEDKIVWKGNKDVNYSQIELLLF